MNEHLRIERLRWWHLPEVARLERAIFGPEAWSEGLLWTELSAGNDYRAVFDHAGFGRADFDRADFDRAGLDRAGPDHAALDNAPADHASPDRAPLDPTDSDHAGPDDAGFGNAGPDRAADPGAAEDHAPKTTPEPPIAGYAGIAFSDTEVWINNIAVAAAYRRRGVARMLMDDALARARAAGAKAVYLEVAVDNVPAQRLYDAYGFYGIGVRKNYYQHTGTDAAVMRMDL